MLGVAILGFSGGGAGAIVGLVVGVSLSVYVTIVDMRKRAAGTRTRVQYRASLVVVPALLAGLGALVGVGIARLV